MAKVGVDDYLTAHSIEEFNALPRGEFENNPEWDNCEEWYRNWTKKKEFAAATPNIGQIKCTDLGNGERFGIREKDNIHWSDDIGWRYWDGIRWCQDKTIEIHRRAATCVRQIYAEATQTKDQERRKALAQWAFKSEAAPRINAMVEMGKLFPGVAVDHQIWDQNIWLLNLNNGTLNLQTGEFHEHRKQDFITKLINLDYHTDASCPLWKNFLQQVIENPDDRRFLQKAVGYSLTGSTKEQCFFILYGLGANGKSTFINTIDALLAGYAEQTNAETLMVKQGGSQIPNDVAKLAGARFVCAVETEGNKRLAESLVKRMTGGDKLSARFLNHEFFTFTPTFKLWLAVNHEPRISGTDEGIWRRVRLIPFEVQIPEDKQDPDLPKKLLAELPGILAWAIDGAKIWLAERLGTTTAVKTATNKYREKSDSLNDFIDECCTLGTNRYVSKADLYDKYSEWAKKAGEYILSKKSFGTRFAEKGYKDKKNVEWLWVGVTLNSTPNSTLFE